MRAASQAGRVEAPVLRLLARPEGQPALGDPGYPGVACAVLPGVCAVTRGQLAGLVAALVLAAAGAWWLTQLLRLGG